MAQPAEFIRAAGTIAQTIHRALFIHDDAPLFGTILRNEDHSARVVYRTSREVLSDAIAAAAVFQSLGLKRRSMIGICARNSPEWLVADFGAALNDMVVVGMLPSWPREYKEAVLLDADIECIVCDETQAPTFLELRATCSELKHVVVINNGASGMTKDAPEHVVDWAVSTSEVNLASATSLMGVSLATAPLGRGFGDPSHVSEDSNEVATLIYSSGTSGMPKGVTISKRRWKTDQLAGVGNVGDVPRTTCHQELGHGCDRGLCWQAALGGSSIVFVRHGYEEMLEDMQVVRPNFLMAMSHFWTRLHVEHEEYLQGLAREHAQVALQKTHPHLSLSKHELDSLTAIALEDPVQGPQLRETASAHTRRRTGDSLNMLITGGSHTSTATMEFMKKVFVRPESDADPRDTVGVHNAYGSTEFPGISVDGDVSPLVKLELVDVPEMGYFSTDLPFPRGEIRVRNKDGSALSSYWRRPEETQKVFSDGWYYTGDIGLLDDKKKLHIIDRRSNLIELYVEGRSVWVPFAELELVYSACPAVHQIFLYGDRNADCVLACIVPRISWVLSLLKEASSDSKLAPPAAPLVDILSNDTDLRGIIESAVLKQLRAAGAHAKRASHELPGAVILHPEPWTLAEGELSASGKIKRSVLSKRFRHEFEEAYANLEAARRLGATPTSSDSPNTIPNSGPAIVSASQSISGDEDSTATFLPALSTAPDQALAPTSAYREILAAESQKLVLRRALITSPPPASGDTIDFVFDTERALAEGRDPDSLKAAQEALELARAACLVVRKNLRSWQSEHVADFTRALSDFEACANAHSERLYSLGAEVIEKRMELGAGLARIAQEVMLAQAEVWRAYKKLTIAKTKEHVETAKALMTLRMASDVTLQKAARNAGLRVPFQITSGLWAVPEVRGESFENIHRGAGEGGLGSSLGDVHIWCDLCARTLESDFQPSGRERMHSGDTTCIDYCIDCYQLMQKLGEQLSACKGTPSAPVGSAVTPTLAETKGIDAQAIIFKSVFPHATDYFSKESMAIYWMQDIVKSADHSRDTPASFIHNAFSVYGDRLALGFADPSVVVMKDTSASAPAILQASPLFDAARIKLLAHESFLWATYAQLGRLSRRVAQGLVSLPGVKRGDHIGICGYNTLEWSVADFACALAGMVVVGLHTTYDAQTATEVINRADITCIFIVASRLKAPPKRDNKIPEWSWDQVADSCPNVKHVVVLDGPGPLPPAPPTEAASAAPAAALAPALPPAPVTAAPPGAPPPAEEALQPSNAEAPQAPAEEAPPPPAASLGPAAPIAQAVVRLVSVPPSEETVKPPPAPIVSALDMVSPDRVDLDQVDIGDPYSHKGSGIHKIFTIFFTSGSSGVPKGVMCSASAFVSDIRGRAFVTPLVTASYIPLSHTSDRMKLWEFLGNGGRVGFCAYAASNWLEHEQSKKAAMVRSSTVETNNVEGLLRQVECLSPVGMACPPRIWNGLFALFKAMISGGEMTRERARDEIAAMFGQRIKSLFTGGAPTSEEVKGFVRWVFPHCDFHDSYGTTESGAITEDGMPMTQKGVEVALLDVPEAGFLGSDKPYPRGEIIVKGPNMTSGYYKDPKATEEQYLADGWYRTGDLGMITAPVSEECRTEVAVRLATGGSERGCIFRNVPFTVVERLTAVASLRDGEMVYPSQIEALLEGSCPIVQQAFVTVSKRCNCLLAVIVLKEEVVTASSSVPTHDEVLSIVSRTLTEQKRPEYEIPRAVSITRVPFSVENGLLNSQLKKARKAISIYAVTAIAKMEEELLRTEDHPPARCCATHALFARDPTQDTEEESAVRAELCAKSNGPTWVVLVAGETSSMMKQDKAKTRPGKYLGGHSSLEQIGSMYQKIADFFPRERIIVIAQLQETIEWLTHASESEESCERVTGTPRLVKTMQERLRVTLHACERLLKDGGADYDYDLVNPATVINVLRGKATERVKKVVPKEGVGSLFIIINSHGNNHRVSRDHHSYLSKQWEWYFHLPYPCPPEDLELYNFSCYSTYSKPEELNIYSPESILYAQMLFACYHDMLEAAPERKIISLYQFCLSGGAARFMDLHSYRSYYNTHRWPVYMVATSGDYESSLANFLPLFGNALREALAAKRQVTLRQLYKEVEADYWKWNESVSLSNSFQADCLEHLEDPLTFGRMRLVEGSGAAGSMLVSDLG